MTTPQPPPPLPFTETIRLSFLARDLREKSQYDLIEHSRKLSNQLIVLKGRNNALLRASSSTGGVTSNIGGASGNTGSGASGGDLNPVRQAYLTSLEVQLSSLRLELSEQYKIQSSNAQRLLLLTDTLREGEEKGREEREEFRKLKSEVEGLRERSRWVKEVVGEKERQLLILQDEFNSLELELSQILIQNENLKIDNSSLLQRWIESKNAEADKWNEANTRESLLLSSTNSNINKLPAVESVKE